MRIDKLDKIFSIYVRRKYADDNGAVKCCTCDRVEHWKEMDAGHYYGRSSLSTRWDERNCHPQCLVCNRVNGGELDKYWLFMANKYGHKELQSLFNLARSERHWMQHEIDEKVEYFKQKIKDLG